MSTLSTLLPLGLGQDFLQNSFPCSKRVFQSRRRWSLDKKVGGFQFLLARGKNFEILLPAMPSEAVRTTCALPSPVERDLGVTICPPAPLHPPTAP